MKKLRHKGTGETISCKELLTDEFIIDLFSKDFNYFYSKIEKILDVWELYEEKKFWYIYAGRVFEVECNCIEWMYKATGNYFKTKKEAEEAVEKLKAWKRLKDKGFKFDGWTIDDGLRISVCTIFDSDGIYDEDRKEEKKDLDICFGGEE